MEENIDNNKILESNDELEVLEYKFNFINVPWDDRSKKSKFGIVSLLIAIFFATMACVIHNFVMHYREFGTIKENNNTEMNCFRVKMEDYLYVARLHSVSSKELLCIGAVVSATSILANGVCVKSGPIRVHLGSPVTPYCKKGFTVDVIETVYHDGIMSKKLALLSSYDDITKCSSPVLIGQDLNWGAKAHIIGRPLNYGRTLSRQHVALTKNEDLPKGFAIKNLKTASMICVKDLAWCPVRAGDLLVQNGYLYGISATSVHRTEESNTVCFADLNLVRSELRELDAEIV